jgi:hypothetical protein
MKKLVATLVLTGWICLAQAQSDVDALRYTRTDLGFTPRSMAVGGAFGALGGDLSSTAINPAGIAQYRHDYFTMAVGMQNMSNEARYLGSNKSEIDFGFMLPNIGYVSTRPSYDRGVRSNKGWVHTNIALSMNRNTSYRAVQAYKGISTNSSMLDYFAQRANGIDRSNLGATADEYNFGFQDLETMAWEAFLINDIGDAQYEAAIARNSMEIEQSGDITTARGAMDYNLSIAANYNHKVLVGGGITLTRVRYEETMEYKEVDLSGIPTPWVDWTLDRTLETKGYGVSGNLGIILKPSDMLRMGLALKTPTMFNLNDEYSDRMTSRLDDGTSHDYSSALGQYDYRLITPFRTTLSIAGIFEDHGFLSMDAEILNFGNMRLRPNIDAFDVANDVISNKYGSKINLRLGGELNYSIFRFRAGIANQASPLELVEKGNLRRTFLTGGLGIYDRDWSFDIALVQEFSKNQFQPYAVDGFQVQAAQNNFRRTQFVVGLTRRLR